MKKLNVLCACLVFAAAATTMTSCVKDSESPSVENIRNAKAEQLKALASMQKAAGEADLIRANAEAALKAAQAKYQEAIAAVQNATAERQQIENQRAKATLELEIKAALREAEAELLKQEQAYAQAKAAYEKWLAQQPVNPYLDGLWLQFTDLADSVNTVNIDLVDAKSTLLSLESGLVTAKDWVATQLKNYNVSLAAAKELKAVYEALPDNGRDAIQAAISTNKAEREGLLNGIQPILDPINKSAKAVVDEYQNTINSYSIEASRAVPVESKVATPRMVKTNSAFMAVTYRNNLSYTYYDEGRQAEIQVADFRDWSGNPVSIAPFQENSMLSAPEFVDYYKIKYNSINFAHDYCLNNNAVDSSWMRVFLTDYVVKYDNVDNEIAKLTGDYETAKAHLATQLAVTPTLATLKTAAATAKADYEKEAAKEQTPAQAVITANKLAAYNTAASNVNGREWSDNRAKTTVNIAAAKLGAMKQFKADIETIDEYKAAVASIQTKIDALQTEKAPYYGWLTKLQVNSSVGYQLNTDLNRNPDLKALIQAKEKEIAQLEIDIKGLELDLAKGTLTPEYAIALQKQTIAVLEAQKAKVDADLAAVKAKIDAEIAK